MADSQQTDRLQTLIDDHYVAIRRSAHAMTGDSWEADELAQETFIAAYASLDRFDANREARPWLFGILIRTRRNRIRSAARRATRWARYGIRNRSENRSEISSDPSPDAAMEASDCRADLWRRVRRLPKSQMHVVVLRYSEQLSVEEIAGIIGCPMATVRSRLHLAIKKLRESYRVTPAEELPNPPSVLHF